MSGITKRVNLQDNIFILNCRLKVLRDTLILDTDPALFLEKVMEDAEFLDQALKTLLEYLQSHERLFERDEVLDYLSDLEWDFSRFLSEFSGSQGSVSAASFPALQDQLRLLRDRGAERLKAIGGDRRATAIPSTEGAVSSDELNELLKDF
jgi:hypothetical protein